MIKHAHKKEKSSENKRKSKKYRQIINGKVKKTYLLEQTINIYDIKYSTEKKTFLSVSKKKTSQPTVSYTTQTCQTRFPNFEAVHKNNYYSKEINYKE